MAYYFRSRKLCTVLEEMRKCYETLNFGALRGLIEEAQSMGNRMEATFETSESLEDLHRACKAKLKECKDLEKKIEALEKRKNDAKASKD